MILPALLCAACGSTSPAEDTTPSPPPRNVDAGPPPTNTCADYQSAALSSLSMALETYSACRTDADCSTIAFGASCFDACSRAIATTDKAAFETAVEDINHTQCQAYTQAGCPQPESPPCEPPMAPHCKQNRCQ
ncbi:MAG TPA: hypothetical protein VGM39_02415 [Kofleriaceae bacterium]